MPITISCPKCQTEFKVPSDWAGKTGICRKCHTEVPIPPSTVPVASPPPTAVDVDPFAWVDQALEIVMICLFLGVGVGVIGSILHAGVAGQGADAGAVLVIAIPGILASALWGCVGLAVVTILRMLRAIEQHLRTIARNTKPS